MTTLSPLEVAARPSRLERARAEAFSTQATIEDVVHLLTLLGQASLDDLATHDDKDVQRAMALGALQGIATCLAQSLRRFDDDTRTGTPAALREVIRDAAVDCGAVHVGCLNTVLPWTFDGTFCSPECRVAHMASQGETWSDR